MVKNAPWQWYLLHGFFSLPMGRSGAAASVSPSCTMHLCDGYHEEIIDPGYGETCPPPRHHLLQVLGQLVISFSDYHCLYYHSLALPSLESTYQALVTQDQYGDYVIQHVLQLRKPEERTSVIKQLVGQIVKMSQQKLASNVAEKCLSFDSPVECQILLICLVLLMRMGHCRCISNQLSKVYWFFVAEHALCM